MLAAVPSLHYQWHPQSQLAPLPETKICRWTYIGSRIRGGRAGLSPYTFRWSPYFAIPSIQLPLVAVHFSSPTFCMLPPPLIKSNLPKSLAIGYQWGVVWVRAVHSVIHETCAPEDIHSASVLQPLPLVLQVAKRFGVNTTRWIPK